MSRERLPGHLLGFGAAAISLSLLFFHGSDPVVMAACLFLAVICITDATRYRIPNELTVGFLVLGLTCHSWAGGLSGLAMALTGAAVGFAVLLLPYALGWIGAGDVKAFTALGALVGAGDVFGIFLYAALIGGIVSILMVIGVGRQGEFFRRWGSAFRTCLVSGDVASLNIGAAVQVKVPYAASIALGYTTFVLYGGII